MLEKLKVELKEIIEKSQNKVSSIKDSEKVSQQVETSEKKVIKKKSNKGGE